MAEDATEKEATEELGNSFVSSDQMAKHLSVTPQTLRSWTKRGLIASHCYVKVGTTFRFKPDCTIRSLQENSED